MFLRNTSVRREFSVTRFIMRQVRWL
uniref:Uncharacterized protein n=1 Tax=Arundo donax TaxID=35708 RepID=A0A0A9ABK5_ARUDO